MTVCLAHLLNGFNDNLSLPIAHCKSLESEVFGNFTFVNHPVPAVVIDSDSIPIGEAHTYVYHLKQGHRYHIYLTGEWANPAKHETDYDIYVYKISGMVATFYSSHTEAAGLPEQVGNDELGKYFIPPYTGTYYIVVKNDAVESSAAEAATLMVIEKIEPNQWVSRYMKGKVNEKPVAETNWAYEFVASADRIRLFIDVPSTLDMYEARLYIMGSSTGDRGWSLEGVPVAWGPGLLGVRSGFYGGFNFDPQGFRHLDAMASCERSGEDMVIDYEPPLKGELLYHLVLIAEYGSGTLEFVIQADFDQPDIELVDPPTRVEAGEPTEIEVMVEEDSGVDIVSISYSKDGSDVLRRVDVEQLEPGRYSGIIPGVQPGTVVEYVVEVEDVMGNKGEVRGNYKAIGRASLTLHLNDQELMGGEEAEVRGQLLPGGKDISINYTHGDEDFNFTVPTGELGIFNHRFKPGSTGEWQVVAQYPGDEDYLPAASEKLNFTVSSKKTELSCNASKDRVELKKRVTLYGEFSIEKEGVTVELTLKAKDQIDKLYAETSPSGNFSVDFAPDLKGVWYIKAKVDGDGLVYEGAESGTVELSVVNPSLTTTILRLPSAIAARTGFLIKPPYLYGVVGILGAAGGGIFFLLRRRM
ncbi:MAG: hypothetical protein ACETVY_00735 [Candidatus Bathyarchaeia archaeon]